MTGRGSRARCSSRPACGCARSISRNPADTDWLDAVIREVNAVRGGVGVCDVSTLGKIDIQGADAAEFLNRVYINGWTNLAVGKARYGLMLREDGFVMDDGTTARLGDTHFVMTTTTANAVTGDAASRILPSGAVALARCPDGVGNRAMGAICRSRDRGRAMCCAASSIPSTTFPTKRSLISRAVV